ncbi:hypothetical protein Ddc_02946 [Ditylenchus destructor]|nr:hypothetical protein Ddc_02946 [Ditylenchus destructor]
MSQEKPNNSGRYHRVIISGDVLRRRLQKAATPCEFLVILGIQGPTKMCAYYSLSMDEFKSLTQYEFQALGFAESSASKIYRALRCLKQMDMGLSNTLPFRPQMRRPEHCGTAAKSVNYGAPI